MKRVILKTAVVFLTLYGLTNLSASDDELMLQATPFATIKDKVGKEPMMLEFGATSCHGCIKMGKILFKIKEKYPKSNIYFIDIHKDKESAKKYKIRVIPTQKYLDKNATVIDTHMGVITESELEKKLISLKIIEKKE